MGLARTRKISIHRPQLLTIAPTFKSHATCDDSRFEEEFVVMDFDSGRSAKTQVAISLDKGRPDVDRIFSICCVCCRRLLDIKALEANGVQNRFEEKIARAITTERASRDGKPSEHSRTPRRQRLPHLLDRPVLDPKCEEFSMPPSRSAAGSGRSLPECRPAVRPIVGRLSGPQTLLLKTPGQVFPYHMRSLNIPSLLIMCPFTLLVYSKF